MLLLSLHLPESDVLSSWCGLHKRECDKSCLTAADIGCGPCGEYLFSGRLPAEWLPGEGLPAIAAAAAAAAQAAYKGLEAVK